MKNSCTPPTANNHIDQSQQEGLGEATPVPVDPVIIRVSDLGPKDTAVPPAGSEFAVQ